MMMMMYVQIRKLNHKNVENWLIVEKNIIYRYEVREVYELLFKVFFSY